MITATRRKQHMSHLKRREQKTTARESDDRKDGRYTLYARAKRERCEGMCELCTRSKKDNERERREGR